LAGGSHTTGADMASQCSGNFKSSSCKVILTQNDIYVVFITNGSSFHESPASTFNCIHFAQQLLVNHC
jgi:hypothetical protein